MIGRSGVASKSDGIVQLGLRVNDVPPTSGFASYAELADHFHKHITQRREFACADEKEYEAAAIAFITPDEDPPNTEDCVRARDNTLIRFDRRRNMICYLHADGAIGSYHLVRNTDPYAYFRRKCRGQ